MALPFSVPIKCRIDRNRDDMRARAWAVIGNADRLPPDLVDSGLAQELLDMAARQCCRTGLCLGFPVPVDLLHHPEGGVPEELHAMLRLDAGRR